MDGDSQMETGEGHEPVVEAVPSLRQRGGGAVPAPPALVVEDILELFKAETISDKNDSVTAPKQETPTLVPTCVPASVEVATQETGRARPPPRLNKNKRKNIATAEPRGPVMASLLSVVVPEAMTDVRTTEATSHASDVPVGGPSGPASQRATPRSARRPSRPDATLIPLPLASAESQTDTKSFGVSQLAPLAPGSRAPRSRPRKQLEPADKPPSGEASSEEAAEDVEPLDPAKPKRARHNQTERLRVDRLNRIVRATSPCPCADDSPPASSQAAAPPWPTLPPTTTHHPMPAGSHHHPCTPIPAPPSLEQVHVLVT